MISLERTATSLFLVPLLGIDRSQLHDERMQYINGYLKDTGREIQYNDAVYILFQPKDNIFFLEFLEKERERGAQIVDEYDYEGNFVVLVYLMPKISEEDFELFKKGKYSQFSDELKQRYPKVVKIIDPTTKLHRDEVALQWRIFKKDHNLKEYWEKILYDVDQGEGFPEDDFEVWSVPNMERETLKISEFQNKKITT